MSTNGLCLNNQTEPLEKFNEQKCFHQKYEVFNDKDHADYTDIEPISNFFLSFQPASQSELDLSISLLNMQICMTCCWDLEVCALASLWASATYGHP